MAIKNDLHCFTAHLEVQSEVDEHDLLDTSDKPREIYWCMEVLMLTRYGDSNRDGTPRPVPFYGLHRLDDDHILASRKYSNLFETV